MDIIINSGERALADACAKNGIKYKTGALTIGDIHIISAQDNKIVYIIERKTYADYAASMRDGRSKEQCQRMLATGLPTTKMCYLLEDPNSVQLSNIDMIESSIIHKTVALGIPFFKSNNIAHTAILIGKIARTLSEDHTIHGYDTSANIKKRALLTQKDVFVQQLACIPGISKKMALEIAFQTGNMYTFLLAIWNGGSVIPQNSMLKKKPNGDRIKKYVF